PLRVGRSCLPLRRDVAAEPDWEMYPASAQGQLPAPPPPPAPAAASGRAGRGEGSREQPLAGWEPSPGAVDRPEPARDAGRWHDRWKAVAAHLEARSDRLRPGDEAQRAASDPGLDVVPLKEPKAVRPRGTATPLIDPTARPIPAPKPPKPEPLPDAGPTSL